jgi:UDP-N-acetylglucosamine 2-epimerase (non-hydrolysing)
MTFVLHPNPAIAGEMRRLLSGSPKTMLRDPCTHLEMMELMRESDLILSDSGGVQEEAPTLGVPLLVLRDRTERPEGILSGNALLVGRNPERILETVDRLLSDPAALEAMRRPAFPYGDGRAAERVATAVEEWLMLNKRAGAAGPVYPPHSSSLAPVVAGQL